MGAANLKFVQQQLPFNVNMNKKILLIVGIFCLGILILIYFNPFNWWEDDVKYYGFNSVSANQININQSKSTMNQFLPNPELEHFDVSIDNGLKVSYRGYAVTYQPVFVMQNNNTFKWSDIPNTIGKDLWRIKLAGNKYKWGVDFSNVSTNIKNNLKWVVLNRTNATKEVWNNETNTTNIVPMTLQDIQGKVRIEGNTIILNNKIFLSHDDILSTYNIPVINRSMIVISGLDNNWTICDNEDCSTNHTEYNWIDNGDGTWNISFDPIITIDESNWITTSLLTNITAESGDANFTHLNISDVAPYDSLVGYWNFDGDLVNTEGATSYDWNGQMIDATMVSNAVTNSSNCLPNYGNCIQLDGVDEGSFGDSINLGDNDIIEGIDTFAVSAWVYPRDVSTLAGIVSKFESGQSSFFLQQWSSNDLDFRVINGTSSYSPTATFANAFLTNNIWYHVLGVYNGTHVLVYVNGVQGGTIDELIGVTATSTSDTLIGAYRPNDRFYNGSIDEVMIFNASLTAQQVLDIYNNQSSRFLPTGTQDLFNQTFMNISSGNNRVNVSTTIQNNFDSSINLTVGYYDGSWSATAPQIVVSDINLTFEISGTSTNLTLNYTFIAGNTTSNPFYSPIIQGDIVFETFSSAVEDTTSPTWSGNQTNNTVVSLSTNFSLQVNDETALEQTGQYIFSTNNSGGTWTNDSAVNFTATPSDADVTKVLNDSVGISIGYIWYLTDDAGNLNVTDTFVVITTSAVADSCSYTSSNWFIECSDFCNISSNVDVLGNNVTVNGTGELTLTANIINYTRRLFLGQDSSNICTIRGFGGWFQSKG
jgi:hypothetical protein